MAAEDAGKDRVVVELQRALARLHADLARVEFWADALDGFSRPVPEYDASGTRLNRYILPFRRVEDALERLRDKAGDDPQKRS